MPSETVRIGDLPTPDSPHSVHAAVAGGVDEVLIDVSLRRCGCAAEQAGELADLARRSGLRVRGVTDSEDILDVWPVDLRGW
ncbi:MAG: hypothetical protein ACRDRL_03645 [Sciscionella sp.]